LVRTIGKTQEDTVPSAWRKKKAKDRNKKAESREHDEGTARHANPRIKAKPEPDNYRRKIF
jgi:hypothetical protein